MATASNRATTKWTTRVIPFVLGGCVGLATYVVVKRISVDFYLRDQQQTGTAVALLVVYFVLFTLMIASYVRLFVVVKSNRDIIPLGPRAVTGPARQAPRRRRRSSRKSREIEAQRYVPNPPDNDPDSPGLEKFYSKDVFVCEPDGRPRWCSMCGIWKEDRTYHNSEINRCVRKLDHFCPWVGGIVAQSSFKFFVQFTFYTMLYCATVLTATVLRIRYLITNDESEDGFVDAIVAIGALFGLFTFMMTSSSLRYIFINLTNVEVLKMRGAVIQLAIRVPRGTQASLNYGVVTYPLPKPDSSSSHLSGQTIVAEDQPQDQQQLTSRDLLATRCFAIVRTNQDENPWDLGWYKNWKSVMGSNVFDWLLPVRISPCTYFENNESFYEMGSVYRQLRRSYGLPGLPDDAIRDSKEPGVELS